MKRLLFALAALAAASQVAAGAPPETVDDAYVLELEDGIDVNEFAQAMQANASARIRRQMDYKLYKAVAIDLEDPSKANDVAAMAGVKKMTPVEKLNMNLDIAGSPSAPPNDGKGQGDRIVKRSLGVRSGGQLAGRALANKTPKTANVPHVMMQIDQLHRKGITGKGSKIAIIDTGIDFEHPALGGCFGPNCRVSFGANLMDDGEEKPTDCEGHGTFIAGLIVAQPNEIGLVGVAPDAELGAYRITCDGQFTNDAMIDALYRAHDDGATIISSSAGNPGGWSASLYAEAASKLAAAGVVFVQGAGNDGMSGVFSLLDPAGSPDVITVGMMMNEVAPDFMASATYSIDGGEDNFMPIWSVYHSDPITNFTGTPMELYAASLGPDASDEEDCGPLPDDTPDLSDKLVLTRFCKPPRDWLNSLAAKGWLNSLAAKGAQRVLLYNNPDDGPPESFVLKHPLEKIVALSMIETDLAASLLQAVRNGSNVAVTAFTEEEAPKAYREGPILEDAAGAVHPLSSWGPSWDLALKPSVASIASMLVSTARLGDDPDGFETREGTSYANPMVAGVAALIAEARGSHDPATIQSLLVSHSNPQRYHDGENFQPYLAPVAQQGGGLIRAYDAAYATTILELKSAGLNFNDTEHFVPSLEFSLRNDGEGDITYNIYHVPAVTIYTFTADGAIAAYPYTLDPTEAAASLSFGDDTLAVASKQSATVRVTAAPPEGLDAQRLALWSGWIAVNGTDGSSLSIPYQGLSGSIREHQVLKPDGVSFSYQNGSVSETSTIQLPSQGSAEKSQFSFDVKATLGSPLVVADVVSLAPGSGGDKGFRAIGQVHGFPVKYMPSSMVEAPDLEKFTHFVWNGLLDSGDYVPEGSYKLVVRALRIFGNPDEEKDWDMSESPEFSINYAGSTKPEQESDNVPKLRARHLRERRGRF